VADVGIAELLEAGVHFGHQTRRWNPKMRRFIFGERGGIYIIDLIKTAALLAQAQEFAGTLAHRGGTVLFVGTKKQARDTIKEVAEAAGMPYVNHRWLGGLLTNFQTINQRIRRLHDLERFEAEGQLALLPTRERMAAQADLAKLRANLGGVKNMQRVPDAMFVIDLKTEEIAVKEARRLRIPIMGLVDTNCDPDGIDFVIPGNDDAIRSCALITQAIGQVVSEGHSVFRAQEERARQEAEERARLEAEARAKREAEEQAKREAEEQAAKEAAEREAAEAAARAAAAQAAQAPASPPAPAPEAAGQAQGEPAAQASEPAPSPPQSAPSPAPAPAQGEDAVHAEAEAQADTEARPPVPAPEPAQADGAVQGEDAVHAEAQASAEVKAEEAPAAEPAAPPVADTRAEADTPAEADAPPVADTPPEPDAPPEPDEPPAEADAAQDGAGDAPAASEEKTAEASAS
jgi:small subunit ribosomal protein S2